MCFFLSDIATSVQWYVRTTQVIFFAYAKSDIAPAVQLWNIPIIPYVIPPMSSEETCLQGFSNDDIFEVIEFAFMQI